MKADRRNFWIEWGFRLLILMLLGLWFFVPNSDTPVPSFPMHDLRGGYHD